MKFSGQGRLYVADRSVAGLPQAFDFLGCVDDLSVDFTVDAFEHTETCTGSRGVDYRGIKKKSGAVNTTLTEFTVENMLLLLNGTKQAAGTPLTVTAEVIPAVVVGQSVVLGGATPHQAITTLIITDSAALTLVLNTDYTLNAATGLVTFLTIPGAQPYDADYGYTNAQYVSIFTAGTEEKWLRFNYLNTANNNAAGVVDLYKVRFDPTSSLVLINDELATFPLAGSVLIDEFKADGGAMGQFGRITMA